MLSIKALADSLKIHFRLKPLMQVERQITQEYSQKNDQGLEVVSFNKFLLSLLTNSTQRNNSMASPHFAKTLPHLLLILVRNFLPTLLQKKSIEISLENAYKFIELDSELYRKLVFNTEAVEKLSSDDVLSINVHLRFVNFTFGTERYLDSEFYFKNLDQITQKLDRLGLKYVIQLHSDFEEFLPDPSALGISQLTLKYLADIGVTDQEGKVSLETLVRANDCKKKILQKYKNVDEFNSHDPLASLIAMTNSDYLILSKSSFAFVAGILNKNGKVISPLYWNHPLRTWNNI